jgi:hypothetical protein
LFEAELGGSAETETGESSQVVEIALELDAEDVNDIIRALGDVDFDRYIVLEDFHYLPDDTQQEFAIALKAFHESSKYSFIIVGVWLDQNRLTQYNGDLAGRVNVVNADEWQDSEIRDVIHNGEKLLNVTFDEPFIEQVISRCLGSIYVAQEACNQACHKRRVIETQDDGVELGGDIDVAELIENIVDSDSARYESFISQFAGGFRETELEMYKYLLLPILLASTEDLKKGLSYADIKRDLWDHHPHGKNLNLGNLTLALQAVASLQVSKLKMKPIVLDYDQSGRRLNVVDRGFLIWLGFQDRDKLVTSLGFDSSNPAAV